MNLNIGEGQFAPEDSLSSELDRGDATARAIVEHLKRMGAANMLRVLDGFKVSVEQEPVGLPAAKKPLSSELDPGAAAARALVEAMKLRGVSGSIRDIDGFRVEVTKLKPQPADLPPPHDSQEEAQRAAGIWPQEAEPATVRVKPSALDEMAAQAASWRGRSAEVAAMDVKPTGIDATLTERGSRYGKFEDHSEVSQALKKVVFTKRPRETLAADQIEALEMICHKLGRIVNGDPNYADSWVDIAGYAKLVADRLEGVSR